VNYLGRSRRLPEEPLPGILALWATPNLIMSPALRRSTMRSPMPKRALDIFLGTSAYLAGRQLVNVVDTRLGY